MRPKLIGLVIALTAALALIGSCAAGEHQRQLDLDLMEAVARGDLGRMEWAISRGSNVDAQFTFPLFLSNYSYSLFAEAVRRGNRQAVALLLRRGANPESRGRWHETAMAIATRRKDWKMVELLERYGAKR